jgi:hypothetical protein
MLGRIDRALALVPEWTTADKIDALEAELAELNARGIRASTRHKEIAKGLRRLRAAGE